MRRNDLISGLFFLLLAVGTCILSVELKLGNIYEPGAGLIPFGAGALLGLMSLGLVFRQLLVPAARIKEETSGGFKGIAWGRLAFLLCSLLAFGVFLDTLGFHLCTFFLMVLLLAAVGRQGFFRTCAYSVLIVVLSYLIFEAWLGCPFPRGPFNI